MVDCLLIRCLWILSRRFRGHKTHWESQDKWSGNCCRVQKKGSFGRGVFSENPFPGDSWAVRDSRDFREPPDCGEQSRIGPLSRDSSEFREFRDSRDTSSEAIVSKTPLKQARNQNTREAAILNRLLDRDWALNRARPLSSRGHSRYTTKVDDWPPKETRLREESQSSAEPYVRPKKVP